MFDVSYHVSPQQKNEINCRTCLPVPLLESVAEMPLLSLMVRFVVCLVRLWLLISRLSFLYSCLPCAALDRCFVLCVCWFLVAAFVEQAWRDLHRVRVRVRWGRYRSHPRGSFFRWRRGKDLMHSILARQRCTHHIPSLISSCSTVNIYMDFHVTFPLFLSSHFIL